MTPQEKTSNMEKTPMQIMQHEINYVLAMSGEHDPEGYIKHLKSKVTGLLEAERKAIEDGYKYGYGKGYVAGGHDTLDIQQGGGASRLNGNGQEYYTQKYG